MDKQERKECAQCQKLPPELIKVWWSKVSGSVRLYLIKYQELTSDMIEKLWKDIRNVDRDFCVRFQTLASDFIAGQWGSMDFHMRTLCCLYQVPPPDLVLAHWDVMTIPEQKAVLVGECFAQFPLAYLPQFLTMENDVLRQMVLKQLEKRGQTLKLE